jgi:hypothetical protein
MRVVVFGCRCYGRGLGCSTTRMVGAAVGGTAGGVGGFIVAGPVGAVAGGARRRHRRLVAPTFAPTSLLVSLAGSKSGYAPGAVGAPVRKVVKLRLCSPETIPVAGLCDSGTKMLLYSQCGCDRRERCMPSRGYYRIPPKPTTRTIDAVRPRSVKVSGQSKQVTPSSLMRQQPWANYLNHKLGPFASNGRTLPLAASGRASPRCRAETRN